MVPLGEAASPAEADGRSIAASSSILAWSPD